jgi:serine/threonine-protein kinase
MTDPRTPEHWTPRPEVPSAPGDFAPGTLLGDWSVEQKIGEGGMGTVYAAVHAEIGKRAALKVIRAELSAAVGGAERFVQEARLVNEIGHPNIVDIFHIGRLDDGRPYLVMELLRGRTLGERMADGRVPSCDAIQLLLQICAGLAAAHARGVVHRDLKPDNVFVVDTRSGPLVKIVDWGIAKLSDTRAAQSTALTRTGAMVGTPMYVSPEQARGRDVDERTDLYSLGVIAYELLLEEPPFSADNVADLIAMHLREPVPPPSEVWPDIPPALEALLVAMLAKRPEARPDLSAIMETLESVRVELEARSETRRHDLRRLANGSLPPELAQAASDGRVVTSSGGVPVVFAQGASSPFVRVVGSGPIDLPVLTEERLPTEPEPLPAPRRGRWIVAVSLVLAAAAVVGVLAVRDRAAGPAAAELSPEPATAVEPEVPEPAQKAVEPAVEPAIAAPAPAAAPSTLEIVVTPRRARVRIDGEPVSVANGRAVRAVAAGAHQVEIDAPGHVGVRRTLEVGDGTLRLEIALDEEPRRNHRRRAERRQPDAPAADPDGTIDPFE